MKHFPLVAAVLALLAAGCAPAPAPSGKKTIVVTYSILGSLVKDLAGEEFDVAVSMPNGLDPHEWEPSAQDIEALNKASLIVANGLNLEGGMEGALAQAAQGGVPIFTASEHLVIRTVKEGQGLPTGDEDQAVGAQDPHLWLDPVRLKSVVSALAAELKTRFGTDLDARAADLNARLDALAAEIAAGVASLPVEKRLLVTGHESLGYFAEAFGFTLIGAIVPSLTSQAEVSASDMAALKKAVQGRKVTVLFTELGTPPKVAEALGTEVGARVVAITTHSLLADGSYFTFVRTLAKTVIEALRA
jgi:zinc/manganese transport system substrate-binding protein